MKTGLIIGTLVCFAALMFAARYFRAKKKVDAVCEIICAAHAESNACDCVEKDEISVRELVAFATANKYNHLTFKDIVSLIPSELISESARNTVLATLESQRNKK